MIVVQHFVEIDFAVAVQIVQHRQLIAAGEMDFSADDLQAERLKQSRSDPLPMQRRLARFALHDPHIAIPRADGDATVGEEIEAGESQLRQPRVRIGRSQHIDGQRLGVVADRGLRFKLLRPTAWTTLCQQR